MAPARLGRRESTRRRRAACPAFARIARSHATCMPSSVPGVNPVAARPAKTLDSRPSGTPENPHSTRSDIEPTARPDPGLVDRSSRHCAAALRGRAAAKSAALCVPDRRDRLRSGAAVGPVLEHRHRRHLRSAADLRLSRAADQDEAADRAGDARDLGRFQTLHVQDPPRHLLRARPGVQRPQARADGAGLRLLDQAPLRPALEKPQPLRARERQAARPERAAQAGAGQQAALRLRHRGRPA